MLPTILEKVIGIEQHYQWENTYDCWNVADIANLPIDFTLPTSISANGISYEVLIEHIKWLEKYSVNESHDVEMAARTGANIALRMLDSEIDENFSIINNAMRSKITDYVTRESRVHPDRHLDEDSPIEQIESYLLFNNTTTVELLRSIVASDDLKESLSVSRVLELIADRLGDRKVLLLNMDAIDRTESSLLPHPVLYHDTAMNHYATENMTAEIPGVISAGLYNGEILQGWGDIDANAEENMWREIAWQVGYRKDGAIAPPNITNLKKIECKLKKADGSSPDSVILICNSLERLNPTNFIRLANKNYGESKWILLTEVNGHPQQAELRDKKEWKITSNKVPLVTPDLPDSVRNLFIN